MHCGANQRRSKLKREKGERAYEMTERKRGKAEKEREKEREKENSVQTKEGTN